MELTFNAFIVNSYTNNSQKIRILTENWVSQNMFCPICGKSFLSHYENNKPVADFFCTDCNSDFELKSKESYSGDIGKKINDGSYDSMISRITSMKNPNFFFLSYYNKSVNNFLLIPNHFFTPSIIEKRKPLSQKARRAGWVGCNINLNNIPLNGKIYIIKQNIEQDKNDVIENYKRIKSLFTNNLETRGWLLDVLICLDKIPNDNFSLSQAYCFEKELALKHPENNFIKDKIRQQLQYLRDKGFIEFTSRGNYRKIK